MPFIVLVAGSGVGGLTFAKALLVKAKELGLQEKGSCLQVVVLERASNLPSTSGHGLTLFEGVGILRRLGLGGESEDALNKVSSVLTRQQISADSSTMNLVTSMDGDDEPSNLLNTPRGIRRPALVKLLKESLSSDVIIKFDWEVVKAVDDGEKVCVTSQRNEEMTGDILVGFDGIGSRVCATLDEQLLGTSQTQHVAKEFGKCCVLLGTAKLSSENLLSAKQRLRSGTLVHHFDRCTGSVGVYSETTDGSFAWTVGYRCPQEPERNRDWQNNEMALATARDLVQQWSLSDDTVDFQSLLENSAGCLQLGAYTQPSEAAQRPWSNGRLVVGGDAAHAVLPLLGEGANLAMSDAVVLARHIVSALELALPKKPSVDQLSAAFERYEAERRAPSQSGMAMTKALRPIMLSQNWLVCVVRNLMMHHVVASNWRSSHLRSQDASSLLDKPAATKDRSDPHANIWSSLGMALAHVAVVVGGIAAAQYLLCFK